MKKVILLTLVLFVSFGLFSCAKKCKSHDWDEGTLTVAATCQRAGTRTYTCRNCGEKKTETVSASAHAWELTEIDVPSTCLAEGSGLYTCTVCGTVDMLPVPPSHDYTGAYYVTELPTAEKTGKKTVFCANCSACESQDYAYADYTASVSASQTAAGAFENTVFGGNGTYSTMPAGVYAAPTAYPTAGEHPRILFNASDFSRLRGAMADASYADLFAEIVAKANLTDDGTLGEIRTYTAADNYEYGPKGTHNINENLLSVITAKAFLYQMTGDRAFGYDAVKMIKQYVTTMKVVSASDICRNYGYAMFTAAIVYDWCNDLLTETDKSQIIAGVQHKLCEYSANSEGMEVGFPPSLQGPVSGHGAERQILRDYLSFSLAIYDDVPSWYDYVGGRFYEQFVPVRNEYYKAGLVPQGISNYVRVRYTADLWSAWLMTAAVGENPYNVENMKNVMPSFMAALANGTDYFFEEGDDENHNGTYILEREALANAISAYLFEDETAAAWAAYSNYYGVDPTWKFILSVDTVNADANPEDRFIGMDLLTYNGGFEARIVAHSSWGTDSASVFMKIGERSAGNHDHLDSGTFQIYYRGLLTGDSGVYDRYGSYEHLQYHQATVAHNGIIFTSKGDTRVDYGQHTVGEPSNYAAYMTDGCKVGTTTGLQTAYLDAEKTKPAYAYIAGDVTSAYYTSVTSRVVRRMLTVYDTDNPDVPLYFFVYDETEAKTDDLNTVFLLHTVNEPTVNGKTVTVESDGGKLVLINTTGNAITADGGVGNNFVVNGSHAASGWTDGMWGRVEITSTAQSSKMLNAMYVTDKDKTPTVKQGSVAGSDVTGTVLGNTAAVFVGGTQRRTTAFSFAATGSGTLTYYVSGVAAGEWTVTVDDTTLQVTATEEGGLLVFDAPVGNLVLTPSAK